MTVYCVIQTYIYKQMNLIRRLKCGSINETFNTTVFNPIVMLLAWSSCQENMICCDTGVVSSECQSILKQAMGGND